MKKVKILMIVFFALFAFVINLGASSKNSRMTSIVWDKKPIDCTWHYGTQCTGQGDGCDAVPCEQYKEFVIR